MINTLEGFIALLIFVVPGALTGHMVNAKTPGFKKEDSVLKFIVDGIIRSFYIHLLLFILIILLTDTEMPQSYAEVVLIVSGTGEWLWVILTMGISVAFGFILDPLDAITAYMRGVALTRSEDPLLKVMNAVSKSEESKIRIHAWVEFSPEKGTQISGVLSGVVQKEDDGTRIYVLEAATVKKGRKQTTIPGKYMISSELTGPIAVKIQD